MLEPGNVQHGRGGLRVLHLQRRYFCKQRWVSRAGICESHAGRGGPQRLVLMCICLPCVLALIWHFYCAMTATIQYGAIRVVRAYLTRPNTINVRPIHTVVIAPGYEYSRRNGKPNLIHGGVVIKISLHKSIQRVVYVSLTQQAAILQKLFQPLILFAY